MALVFAVLVGGTLFAAAARRGRPAYWLGAAGSALLVFGAMLGPGYLPAGVTSTAIGAGIALGVFAIALDLLLGPVREETGPEVGEGFDRRFE